MRALPTRPPFLAPIRVRPFDIVGKLKPEFYSTRQDCGVDKLGNQVPCAFVNGRRFTLLGETAEPGTYRIRVEDAIDPKYGEIEAYRDEIFLDG